MNKFDELKIGCCGWAGRQEDYFRLFRVIEIQNTFYQLPMLKTAARWRESAPEGFTYTMKAWQLITHEPYSPTYKRLREPIKPENWRNYGRFRPTPEIFLAWERTREFAQTLGARIILFQCPASFHPTKGNVANMQAFFGEIERGSLRFAWEPRGVWPEELIYNLCAELDLIHCVDPFKNRQVYGDIVYYRQHGRAANTYDYHYTESDLVELKDLVGGQKGFVLFNNVYMKEDALRFRRLLQDGEAASI
jgi:uncharacterized protein YecE (DUF72 family)